MSCGYKNIKNNAMDYVLPVCTKDPCLDLIDARCIIYNGLPIASLGINTGDSLSTILSKINTAIGSI